MASDQELARRELARRQQEEADFFSQFANVPLLEEMLAIGTGAISEPLSGLGALFAAPFVGSERAADLVGEFQEDLTYVPRGDRANANLQAVGEFLAPVGEAMDWAAENAGEGVYNLTGSPSAAAFTEGLIQAAPDIAGLRFGKGVLDNAGDIGGQATGMGRREKGIFVGEKAQGVDRDALERAKNLRAQGVDRDAIWNDELWAYSEPEGKWKTELDDSEAQFVLGDKEVNEYGFKEAPYYDAVLHPKMQEAYPSINDVTISHDPTEDFKGAYYDPDWEEIVLGTEAAELGAQVPLHEGQHVIQDIEGFARGGSPKQFWDEIQFEIRDARSRINEINEMQSSLSDHMDRLRKTGENPDALKMIKARYDELMDKKFELGKIFQMLPEEIAHNRYLRLAGEAESRNVETRKDWTMDQRRQTPPWASLDVPEDELIYTTR